MKKINKTRRGFSLVELMVVVAIMGTLAAIAIPAYNEYRKSAKKTAYRTDLLGLHKGIQAFGVELDSYCERETNPQPFNIDNVGMTSLGSSKLYGNNTAFCTAQTLLSTNCATQALCIATPRSNTECAGAWIPAGNGPGKDNFMGFEDAHTNCGNITATQDNIHRFRGASSAMPAGCDLDVTTYALGVAGHISGTDYIGFDVDQDGVTDETDEGAYGTAAGEVLNTTNGVCT